MRARRSCRGTGLEQHRCSPALAEAEDAENLVAFRVFDAVRFLVNVEVVGPRMRSFKAFRGWLVTSP
uniref:Uncharacterized protein n=1 Tax=Solanum lycopersicum TaxID=4081 RepID=A0A3Q7EDK1_SOLLC